MGRVAFKIQKNCENCGIDMGYVHPKRRFCTHCTTIRNAERQAAYYKKITEERDKTAPTVKCKNCGKKFKRINNNQLYCCAQCGNEYRKKNHKGNKNGEKTSRAISPKPKTDWAAIVNKCRELKMSYGEAVSKGLIDD